MNKDSLIELAAWHQSVPVQTFVEMVFSSKPKFMQDSMIQYLIESGIAHFSEEGHVSAYGEYVIEPAAIEIDVVPKLVVKFPAILLNEIRPESVLLSAPMIELPCEPIEEIKYRKRKEALEILINKNSDIFVKNKNTLEIRITKKEVWEKLKEFNEPDLFWKYETFEKYAGNKEGKLRTILGLNSINWTKNRAKY